MTGTLVLAISITIFTLFVFVYLTRAAVVRKIKKESREFEREQQKHKRMNVTIWGGQTYTTQVLKVSLHGIVVDAHPDRPITWNYRDYPLPKTYSRIRVVVPVDDYAFGVPLNVKVNIGL